MNKKLLIVVDMQNDFVDGALGTKEAESIVLNVRDKMEEYRKAGNDIIFTRDTHFDNYLETQEGRNLSVPHCIKNTHGWEIVSELDTSGSLIFDKNIFGSVGLMEYLRDKYTAADFELVGLCTDICVMSNATMLKSFFPESEVAVDAYCCAGVTPERHKTALEAMKFIQINIINEEKAG